MRRIKLIILICALCCGILAHSEDAKELFNNKEYLKAAKLYNAAASQALADKSYGKYLENLLYEGECYYSLNLTSDLAKSLETIGDAGKRYISCVNDAEQRLLIEEGIYKLTGSYNTLLYTLDNSRFDLALNAYQQADSVINNLESTGFDDESLRVDLYRDEVNLYYAAKDYNNALLRCKFVCDFYQRNGMFEDSDIPLFKRYYSLTVDAFRSMAIIKARLNDFDGAIDDIKQIEDYKTNQSLQRTIGKILMMQYDYTGTDNRAKALKCYDAYIKYLKSDLAHNLSTMSEARRDQYWLSMHDFLFDCYRLEDYAPEMLYDLALFAKGYLTDNTLNYKWQNVRDKLSADACAIEFVQYNGKDDAKQLGALVVTANCPKPKFIHIADVSEFEHLPLESGINVGDAIRNDYPMWKNELYNDSTLGSKIWTDELMQAIGSARKVYFAPDGLLHVLAIEYIMPDSLKECHRLSSTRSIINPPKIDINKVLVCGDIDFSTPTVESQHGENDEAAYRALAHSGSYFQNLPGTAAETDSVCAALATRLAADRLKILRGTDAGDAQFCDAAKYADIVHLATHGFFTGTIQSSDLMPPTFDNSLSESGLAMAGVNANLRNSNFDATRYDGIITAKELSTQDFSNVKMMVLSACQTGLGYVTGDGVYGLQRGLKASGVGAMLLSLWSVNDVATCELMRRFYSILASQGLNRDIYQAFMAARKSLVDADATKICRFSAATLSLQQKQLKFNQPQYTNAFILIDVL